jgi:hypothetical protein
VPPAAASTASFRSPQCPAALDHAYSSARATNPARTGFRSTYPDYLENDRAYLSRLNPG